ncbi:MAG: sensor histidine kinase [Pseudonocardiaceae bacterium]
MVVANARVRYLAARLRRNAENLRVLAGRDAGSTRGVAWPLVDVVRAAMSSIEHYRRIEIAPTAALAVVDLAADDLGRLLAELLDNATRYSPPMSKVTVGAHLTEAGSMLVRIEDAGDRLPVDQLRMLNTQLSAADPGSESVGSVEQMGLAVVRRLAGKHGIRVRLDSRATRGTNATVLLPPNLVCEAPATPWFADTPMMKLPRPAPVGAQANPPPALVPPAREPESAEGGTPHATPGTTRNGLPRRIPQSLREFGAFPTSVPSPRDESDADHRDEDLGEQREQLMADLGDFSDGEQAARQERPVEKPGKTRE